MLNLDIEMYKDCSLSKLIIADESEYDNVRVKNPTLEITPPNFPKINVAFQENQVNIYNSRLLNIQCDRNGNLPDGVYTVRYSIQPNIDNFIEKKFFRTEILKCKYGKVLLSLHLEECCSDLSSKLNTVQDAWQLILGVYAAANDCDFVVAYDLYNKACKILDDLKNCEC